MEEVIIYIGVIDHNVYRIRRTGLPQLISFLIPEAWNTTDIYVMDGL